MNLRQELVQLQQEVLAGLEQDIAQGCLEPPAIAQYCRDYNAEIKHCRARTQQRSSLEALAAEVWARRVVAIGDYHSCDAPKRTVGYLLDHIPEGKRVVLGLEFVLAEHQHHLDAYLRGETTKDEFLQAIAPQKWDFNPEPYVELIDLARLYNVPVVGFNSMPHAESVFLPRNARAADIIAAVANEDPEVTVLAFDGDLHVARTHLPREIDTRITPAIGRKNKPFVVRHNDPHLFWQLMLHGQEGDQVFQLNRDTFAVINEHPIEVRNSYLNWRDNQEISLDYRRDLGDTVLQYARQIAHFFGIAMPKEDRMPEVYGSEEANLIGILRAKGYANGKLSLIKRFIREGRSIFLSQGNVIYIANKAHSHIAEEASHALNHACTGTHFTMGQRDEFYYRVMKESVGFMGSLVVFNDRKAPSAKALEENDGERGKRLVEGLNEQRRLDRHYLKSRRLNGYGTVIPALEGGDNIALAEVIGHQLGKQLFRAMIKGRIKKQELAALFTHPFEGNSARRTYYELMTRLEDFGFSRNESLYDIEEDAA